MAVAQRDTASRTGPPDAPRIAAANIGLKSIFPKSCETQQSATTPTLIEWQHLVETGRKLHITTEAAPPGVLVPSHRGIDSTRMLLSIDGRRPSMLLKTIHADQLQFFDAAAAFDAQAKAAALGACPALLASDVDCATSVVEYLDGWRTARVSDLKRPDLLNTVLSVKRSIHSGERFNTSWTVFDRIRMLNARHGMLQCDHPAGLPAMFKQMQRIEGIINAAGVDTVPAHADGLASNILIGPDARVQLVDFDEARNVDPHYELGILLNEIYDNENDALAALEMFEGSARRDTFHRARLYAVADDFAWALWGLFMDATSPRKDVEFWRYASMRLIRCRIALEATDFDRCKKLI
ncbi:phosphotransferase [Mesorhizobium sp. GR13]|uniref:phosphotransferase n=1 Tax=Mesorhizobium sp. GR13 TaxID=2562308 RepID=UPI0010BFC63B